MTEQEKRAAIVTEVRSWIFTPYHIRGRVKGAGADCGSLIMAVGVNCGMIDDEELEIYQVDSWAHWTDEKYLKRLMIYARKTMECVGYRSTVVLPGSVLLTCCSGSKHFNHGAIVTAWPLIVHAVAPKVEEVDITTHHLWAYRKIEVFDFKRVTE
jgi:hypothetical protein